MIHETFQKLGAKRKHSKHPDVLALVSSFNVSILDWILLGTAVADGKWYSQNTAASGNICNKHNGNPDDCQDTNAQKIMFESKANFRVFSCVRYCSHLLVSIAICTSWR